MTATPAPSNHPVFLLAEHLDTILAAIEDLEACRPQLAAVRDPLSASGAQHVSLSDFVAGLKRFEATAIMRIARARELTRALVRRDKRFAMLGGLFVAGTAALDEAVQRMRDEAANKFDGGADPMGFLRSRGVIDVDAGGVIDPLGLRVTDEFRLAGEIEIGPLIDLVSTFLNTIELHFDLFPDLSEPNDVSEGNKELMI